MEKTQSKGMIFDSKFSWCKSAQLHYILWNYAGLSQQNIRHLICNEVLIPVRPK